MTAATRRFAIRFTARGAVAFVAVAAFAAVLVLVRATWSPLHTLDLDVADDLNRWFARHASTTSAVRAVTSAGRPGTWQVLAVVTGVVLWARGRRRLAIFTVVTVLGAGLLSTTVKNLVDRARPSVHVVLSTPGGSSFPSGHALSATVAMGVLVVLTVGLPLRRVTIAVAVLVPLVVGFTRLALGVHYLSDVVGGYLLGVAWLLAMITAFGATERG